MPTLKQIRAHHLRGVTIHEISHAFVELSRSAMILVTFNLNRYFPFNGLTWDGRVEVQALNDDKYQDSVYGWAGVIGEAIEQDPNHAVEIAWERYLRGSPPISDTDLHCIASIPLNARRKSAQTAHKILLKNWQKIKDFQRRTIERIEGENLSEFGFLWKEKEGWIGFEETSFSNTISKKRNQSKRKKDLGK